MLAACDIYRPAAIDQLEIVGKAVNTPVYVDRESHNAVKIAQDAVLEAQKKGCNVLIVDTAGRLQIDEQLMNELKDLKSQIKPHEILLVVDALTGQDAVNIASGFNDALGVDGIIMTKMDGDSRGGAALSVKAVTGKPTKFMGTGEKYNALEPFYPDRIASMILGMGDVMSPIEQAENAFDKRRQGSSKRRSEGTSSISRTSVPDETDQQARRPRQDHRHDPRVSLLMTRRRASTLSRAGRT